MTAKRTWYSVLRTQYLILSTLVFVAVTASAAPPKLNNLFPAGGQRGQSVTIAASGDFSAWPVQAWSDRVGIAATAEKEKGKFKIDVADDAVPGVYWLRLHNSDGASVLKPFVVDTLPEALESEPNDAPDKAQTVEPHVVINGKLGKTGDVDGYRFELTRGQTLVASLQANSVLGSPMDAVLQVCELVERPYATTQTRQTEAYVAVQDHDSVGLDPQIAFTAPHSGAYLVRLFAFPATPDSSVRFAGSDDYIYRLTLTTGPFIGHALPLAVPREESHVRFGGWNLETTPDAIVPPLSADSSALTPDSPFTWVWHKEAAGAVSLPRSDYATLVEPAEIPIPATISGRLEKPGEADSFEFRATKDQKLRIRVAAKALGFPTDPVIAVLDETGKTIAEADDVGRDDRDPQLDFTPSGDGTYRLVVRDLARRGGLRMVYRLTIEPVRPDFTLTLTADSLVLEKDKPLEITVNVAVRDGLREPIEIRALGLPAGVTAEPVKFEPSEDSPMNNAGGGRRGKGRGNAPMSTGPSVKVILKGDTAKMEAGGTPIRIEGRTAGSSQLVRTARFPLNLPLAGQHHAVWLTIRK